MCNAFLPRVAYVGSPLIYRSRHTACVARCFFGRVARVGSSLIYRTRHTACVARCVLGWLMSDLRL